MRFKGFILSEGDVIGRTKAIDNDDAIHLIRKNCNKSLKAYINGNNLFRGLHINNRRFFHVDPKSSYRKSSNTSNIYTLIIDNSPKWKGYPKRSRSIICSANRASASGYGDVFCVFPKDGSVFGVCPSSDIWSSFSQTIGSSWWLDEANDHIKGLAEVADINTKSFYGSSYSDLKKTLTEMDDAINNDKIDITTFASFLKRTYDGDMLKALQDILDPVPNKFYKTNDMNKLPAGGTAHEVWTDGESYLVDEDWAANNIVDMVYK